MSCIILRGCWCSIFVLNAIVPGEDETDDMKDSFCSELEHMFGKFLKNHMKILLGLNVKVGRKYIFKQTIGGNVYTKLVTIMALQ
jgi:hypothetical protein